MGKNQYNSKIQNQKQETLCDTASSACQVPLNLRREFDLFAWVIWPFLSFFFGLRFGVLKLITYKNHDNRNEVTLPKENTPGR